MQVLSALVPALGALVQAVDPNQGTVLARKGAVQRLAEPSAYDVVFPVVAFLAVIVLPSAIAAWVMWRTLRDTNTEPDEV